MVDNCRLALTFVYIHTFAKFEPHKRRGYMHRERKPVLCQSDAQLQSECQPTSALNMDRLSGEHTTWAAWQ